MEIFVKGFAVEEAEGDAGFSEGDVLFKGEVYRLCRVLVAYDGGEGGA